MKKLLHSIPFFFFIASLSVTASLSAQPSFRNGYVITKYGDTLRGQVKNSSAEEVIFRDSQKNQRSFYPADLRGFARCGMVYTSVLVPGDTMKLFIACLVQGAITLYGTIVPENYNEAAVTGLVGGALGGLAGAAATGGLSSPGAGTRDSGCPDDHYTIGRFYLEKGPGGNLLKVPNGRKKFNEFMIPLMRDHMEVVRDTPEALFYAGNTIAIVRQYNSVAVK
jgi:hypothetical protein